MGHSCVGHQLFHERCIVTQDLNLDINSESAAANHRTFPALGRLEVSHKSPSASRIWPCGAHQFWPQEASLSGADVIPLLSSDNMAMGLRS